ncbi:hypothetical protein [Bradyrhizobium sp. MOS002]|uniref:hypothetical protein n=1 Tax=Bradyrhizobium sp. MOS002 TaxID=2133947 RepID=UPI000D120EB2|nr:hypothetical protein [Bradyrhizobium sp. MOS002]PSO29848.1 hypothetical protein C7G41_24195 [Bradyrhizobium sp. MOS002]
MSDVAELGLKVDSTQATTATTALKGLSGAADQAAGASDALAAAAAKAGVATGTLRSMADRAGVSYGEMASRIKATTSNLQQQAGQINNVTMQLSGSLSGTLGTLGLAGIGFGTVLEGAKALFHYLQEQGPTTEKLFAEHNRLLGVIKDSYDRVTDSTRKWFEQSKNVTQVQLLQQQIELQQKLRDEVGNTIKAVTQPSNFRGVDVISSLFGGGTNTVREKFGPFEDAIVDLQQSFKAGTPDVTRFTEAVAKIALADPALQKVAAQLIKTVEAASKVDNALKAVGSALDVINGKAPTEEDRARLGLPDAKVIKATKDALDRATESVEKYILQTNAQAGAVGSSVAEQEKAKVIADLTAAALRDGKTNLQQYAAAWDDLGTRAGEAAQKLALARVHDQIKFETQTTFLSPEDVKIAQQLKGLFPDLATALASPEAAAMRFNDQIKEIRQTAQDLSITFAQDFVQGVLSGKSAMESLTQSAAALGKSLTNAGIANIIKDPTSITGYVEAGIGLVTQLITGNSEAQKKAAEELKQAQDAWKGMTDQVVAFNRAARGFDLGPLTSQIVQLRNTYDTLAMAAAKAKDFGAVAQLQNTFNQGVSRLTETFINGNPVMTDLQQKMKAVADEGLGLIETLQQMGLATAVGTARITDAIARQQAAILEAEETARRAKVESDTNSLIADVRNNSGVGYLNTITDAIQKFNDLAAEGVQPGVLQGWLISTAQTAVNGAKLTGQAFQDLIAEFPQLTNAVHEFIDTEAAAAAATAAAAKLAADATQKLNLQLRLLTATTDTSTQGGALTLFDAKAKQERDAAVAGGISPENLLLLDQALAAERLGVIKTFTDQAVAAEKQLADARLAQMQRIQQYLDNLTAGSGSTLAPGDRLAAAQSQFTSQLGAAKSGDANAIQNITSYSDNLLQAAKDYYGSTVGYQSILAQVQSSLTGLIGTGLAGSVAASGLPGTGSSIPGVSTPTATPAAANTNTNLASLLSTLIAKQDAQTAEIVVLKTTIKASIDTNTQAIGVAHEEEEVELKGMNASLNFLKTAGKLA